MLGPLGDMALVWMELAHGAGTKPLLQPIDQARQAIRCGVILTHGEACLARGERLSNQDMDGSGFEAESSIEAGAETLKAKGDQARNMSGIAARGGEGKIKRGHFAIDAKQQQAQDAHTDIIAGEMRSQIVQQSRRRNQHMLLARNRLEKHGLRAIDRRRHDGDQRLGCMAQRLIEAAQEPAVKARGKGRARLIHHVANAAESQTAHKRLRLIREAERSHGQMAEGIALATARHDTGISITVTCGGPGHARRIGNRKPRRQAKPPQAFAKIGQEGLFAAEEVRASGDVEKQAVAAACLIPGGGDGCIAEGPQRQFAQGSRIGGGISLTRLQLENLRARIGHQVARK